MLQVKKTPKLHKKKEKKKQRQEQKGHKKINEWKITESEQSKLFVSLYSI